MRGGHGRVGDAGDDECAVVIALHGIGPGARRLAALLRQEIDLNAIDFIEDLPYTLTNADAAVEIGTMRIEEGH